ncbi:phosphoribosyl-AMP cyclohydrolase [Pantoea sp. GbtcB22]|jgi:phosphoribosyl-AMP cyclohydrolase|uniref:phosphoribosyl-AMP cyclohydrolase n=1 Tax=Pantoea sp. GbtcB22 TaxID=2824767 RepID=UPI001C30329E|nr:phosphoribosyl-AMP cyclohydrolase [Pantoea sp. GbtcB22]
MFIKLEKASANTAFPLDDVLNAIKWNQQSLIPVITQQFDTGDVLMMAWMNREALQESLSSLQACYWSRSRKKLWRKGETSGCTQQIIEMRLDCDGDALLLLVNQLGAACHTGRSSCFYNAVRGDQVVVLSNPNIIMPNY